MTRFIEIGRQIFPLPSDDDEPINQFAWFDTITDTFLEFSGDCVWETWDEFVESYRFDFRTHRDAWIEGRESEFELDRFKRLYPFVHLRSS